MEFYQDAVDRLKELEATESPQVMGAEAFALSTPRILEMNERIENRNFFPGSKVILLN